MSAYDPAPRVTKCYEGGNPSRNRQGWWFGFDYDEAWIRLLKSKIPAEDRAWDASKKEWWVAREQESALRTIFPSVAAFLDQPRLPL